MTAATGARGDIQLAALDLGEKLGSGGQGDVLRVRNRPGEVLKRYFTDTADGVSMRYLVEFPDTLPDSEREALLRQTAWPLARVVKHGKVVGFLMREVPASFVGQTRAGTQLRELQYLLYPPKPLWGDIVPLDIHGRIEVAAAFAGLVRILQERQMVIGDISMRNLLWSPGVPARICLIDCDSPTRVGMPPVLPTTDTPDWNDPRQQGGPSPATDLYKLALLVGRTLSGNADVRPGQPLKLPADTPEPIVTAVRACFEEAGQPQGPRPEAARWVRALSGRGEILVGPLPAKRVLPPPLPMVDLDGRGGPRGSIPLPPADKKP
ncbi:hypothetical protein ACFO3J_00335 [Streptomyces polygonati]|uniref:Protein kinase domain-containing protein n=1 Tax=Streptomyces polygonati TaxID=1617087 RepID=A0ABV8HGB8_9ACTN